MIEITVLSAVEQKNHCLLYSIFMQVHSYCFRMNSFLEHISHSNYINVQKNWLRSILLRDSASCEKHCDLLSSSR